MLDVVPYDDCPKTNIVLGPEPNIHGPCVLRNRHNDDPSQKYLVFYDSYSKYRPNRPELAECARWCFTAASPDGIHWSPKEGRPAVPGKSDTGQSVVWDAKRKRYIAYMRGTRSQHRPFDSVYGETVRVRYVRASVSPDFVKWSDPIELLRADERDGDPHHQFHQFSVTRRGNCFLGLLSLFHIEHYSRVRDRDDGAILLEEGTCDTQLAFSRDGMNWQRLGECQPFLRLGTPGEWDCRWLTTASEIVFSDDRMLFYYAGYGHPIEETLNGDVRRAIGVATLLCDRFQALRPRRLHQDGVVETVPLYLAEGDLEVNVDAARGRLRVELCDFNGDAIEGFSRDDCDLIDTDAVRQVVRWNGRKLSQAVGRKLFRKAIRIRFYLHQASLYAMYFPAQPAVEE